MEQQFMRRCFELARLGSAQTAPNPMVGAVIVHKGRIIGEGYHQQYGQAHAEVNAVASVAREDRRLLPYSTLYVSLEPCSIYGNTPPCTALILEHKIPSVVISFVDYTPGVDGEGIKHLRENGVNVKVGILSEDGRRLSAPRNTYVSKGRPYIILKYAQSTNGIFAPLGKRQLWLTNPFSKRLVHRWRSEAQAILVGKNTVSADNPKLTNRLFYGPSPTRVVIAPDGDIDAASAVYDRSTLSLIFTRNRDNNIAENLEYIHIPPGTEPLPFLLHTLYERKISTLLVEGGILTLNHFIDNGWWDEARLLIAPSYLDEGRAAPLIPGAPIDQYKLGQDRILIFENTDSQSLNFH